MPKQRAQAATKTETITLRLEPEVRYFAELAARKWRTTVSGFVERAIETAFSQVHLEGNGTPKTMAALRRVLWDVDAEDRFVKLALLYPDMLTYTEQRVWKMIRENVAFWKRSWWDSDANEDRWDVDVDNVHYPTVRRHWALLHEIANGEKDRSALVDALAGNDPPQKPEPVPPPDDEIPF